MASRGVDRTEVVLAAAQGDERAWDTLVSSYIGLIWAIARNHRLSQRDAADVSQTTWLRLVENIDRIDEPARIGAWLATTARRECLRVISRSSRHLLVEEPSGLADAWAEPAPEVDAGLLAREREEQLHRALARLPQRSQELLRLLMLDPAPSYEEISAALGMPIGSIGPTRGRALRALQRILEHEGIAGACDDVITLPLATRHGG